MGRHTPLERWMRGIALVVVILFFMFPLFWIALMSLQTNETILRSPPTMVFEPTLYNYEAIIAGRLDSNVASMGIEFMRNLMNSIILSVGSVGLALILGVPAAYAFARHKFRGSEDIAFTLLSFRFAPPLLVLLPLALYFQEIGLANTYIGLIWVYQLICLPLILWIVRGYFEDISPDVEYAYRIAGHGWLATFRKIAAAARGAGNRRRGAPRVHLRLEQLHLRSGAGLGRQAAGHGRRARLRDRQRHPVRPDRGGGVDVHRPHAAAGALRPALPRRGAVARRGQGLSMGGVSVRGLTKRYRGDTVSTVSHSRCPRAAHWHSSAPPARARRCSCAASRARWSRTRAPSRSTVPT